MFLPNSAGAFGSGSHLIAIRSADPMGKHIHATAYLDIKKKHVKYQDKPSEPCAHDASNINTTACIAEFIQNQIGCSANIQGNIGSNSRTRPPCQSTSDLKKFAAIAGRLQYADESTIYNMTGCLSSCERDKFDIKMTETTESTHVIPVRQVSIQLYLYITIHDTSFIGEEQYVIYDYNSFIADVGGYMGLLLGSSILSLFDQFEGLVNNVYRSAL